MSIPIDVWSDFVCPWCFLAATSLEKLKTEKRIAVHWRSYELRPEGSPPLPAEYVEHIQTRARPRLNAVAWEQYGIEINAGPFGINSRLAHIGAKYAEMQGKSDMYHMAVFRAYWQRAMAIDDRQALAAIAEGVGLERDAFLAALDDPEFKAAAQADEEEAQAHGLTGVPALVFMRRYLVAGAQPYTVLKEIVEKLEAGAAV